jgi:hypothetical protein
MQYTCSRQGTQLAGWQRPWLPPAGWRAAMSDRQQTGSRSSVAATQHCCGTWLNHVSNQTPRTPSAMICNTVNEAISVLRSSLQVLGMVMNVHNTMALCMDVQRMLCSEFQLLSSIRGLNDWPLEMQQQQRCSQLDDNPSLNGLNFTTCHWPASHNSCSCKSHKAM